MPLRTFHYNTHSTSNDLSLWRHNSRTNSKRLTHKPVSNFLIFVCSYTDHRTFTCFGFRSLRIDGVNAVYFRFTHLLGKTTVKFYSTKFSNMIEIFFSFSVIYTSAMSDLHPIGTCNPNARGSDACRGSDRLWTRTLYRYIRAGLHESVDSTMPGPPRETTQDIQPVRG